MGTERYDVNMFWIYLNEIHDYFILCFIFLMDQNGYTALHWSARMDKQMRWAH